MFKNGVIGSAGLLVYAATVGFTPMILDVWNDPTAEVLAEVASSGIYLMKADGSGQTRLTNGNDTEPSWSP